MSLAINVTAKITELWLPIIFHFIQKINSELLSIIFSLYLINALI